MHVQGLPEERKERRERKMEGSKGGRGEGGNIFGAIMTKNFP